MSKTSVMPNIEKNIKETIVSGDLHLEKKQPPSEFIRWRFYCYVKECIDKGRV